MYLKFLPLVLLVGLYGCSGEGAANTLPPTQQVTGAVTLDGQPLQGALVMFVPTGTTAGVECSGVTDTNGVYIPQQMRGEQGVPAGTYKVYISRFTQEGRLDAPSGDTGTGGALMESIPPRYSSPSATTLTANVPEGNTTIDFKLESK